MDRTTKNITQQKGKLEMAMTMYKRYEKIEKPLVELAKQIKKSKANDENIKKGIQLILGEEANAVASYLEDVLGFDSEYALPAMRIDKRNLGHASEPNMQEVENRISDMDECTDLINMITSFLPPGALIVASQAEHYSIMGEILEAYRAKNFMAVKELICANWKTSETTAPENSTDTAPEEDEEKEDDIGYDITDFTEETKEDDIKKFTKLAVKHDREAIEDGWCYTAAGVFTGVLKADMTKEDFDNMLENKTIAIEAIKAYLNCMDFVELDERMLKSEFDKNIRRVEYLITERRHEEALESLKNYIPRATKMGTFDVEDMLNYIFSNILDVPEECTIDYADEHFADIITMTMSILNEVNINSINVDKKIVDETLTKRVNQEADC